MSKRRGKLSIAFISEEQWKQLQNQSDWKASSIKYIKEFDEYPATIKAANLSSDASDQLEPYLSISLEDQKMVAEGDFIFISKTGKPISYFDIETLFDEEIDAWITEHLPGLLFYQGVAHEFITSGKEVGQKTFAGLNGAKVGSGMRRAIQ